MNHKDAHIKSDEIEKLVLEQKSHLANRLIKEWLKERHFSKVSLYQSVQWYRRMSFFREALNLLLKVSKQQSHTDPQVQLWLADCFNSIGSNYFAAKILDPIVNSITEVSDLDVAAGIYLGVGQNDKAALLFRKVVQNQIDKHSHFYFMAQVSLADSEVRLGNFDSALKIVREVKKQTKIQTIKNICTMAEGEYLARKGNCKSALRILNQVLMKYTSKEKTYDYALLLKWLGYCYCKLGRQAEGIKFLDKSYALMSSFGMGLDQWLDILTLKQDLSIIKNKDETKLNILNCHIYEKTTPSKVMKICSRHATLSIYLNSKEYCVKNKFYYHLPKEVELLALLRVVESLGISAEIVKGKLWPNEVYSYLYLEQRLFLLINRLKKVYKVSITVRNGILYLDKKDWTKLSVFFNPTSRPTFFENFKVFKGTDVSKYYSCKHNQRAYYLKKWKVLNWIQKEAGFYTVK